jgi:hypothetical protein
VVLYLVVCSVVVDVLQQALVRLTTWLLATVLMPSSCSAGL